MNPSLKDSLIRLDHALADYAPGDREAVDIAVAELVRELHDMANLAEHFRATAQEQAVEIRDMEELIRQTRHEKSEERERLFWRLRAVVSESRARRPC